MASFVMERLSMTAEEKVDILFKKYYSYLVIRAKQILFSHASAEDAVQDTFIRLVSHGNLSKIEDVESKRARNFLLTILTRVALTKLKTYHQKSGIEFREEMYGGGADVSKDPTCDTVEQMERRELLKLAISKLSQKDQELLIYRFVYELSFKEISECLGIPVNYATARVSRLYRKLHKELTGTGSI